MDSLSSDNVFAEISDLSVTSLDSAAQLTASLLYAQEKLSFFAQQADLQLRLAEVFGTSYDATVAESILQSWAINDFSTLPQIRVLDAASMSGIRGGYTDNVIYINADFLSNSTSEQVGGILLEEIGHWLDSQINIIDAVGDEGELFSAIVTGQMLTSEEVQIIQSENDFGIITVDGQLVQIEQAISTFDLDTTTSGVNRTVTFTEVSGADNGSAAVSFTNGTGAPNLGLGGNPNNLNNSQVSTIAISFATSQIPNLNSEFLLVGNTAINLSTNGTYSTTISGITSNISISTTAGIRTVTFTKSGSNYSQGEAEALLDNLRYNNTSDTPTSTSRTFDVTITQPQNANGSGTATASFVVNITPVNDNPVLLPPNPIGYIDTADDDNFSPLNGTLAAIDPDAGQTLTYGVVDVVPNNSLSGFNLSKSSSYGTLYLNSSTGAYRFVPNDTAIEALQANASASFTVTVSDGNGGSDSKLLTINLTGANDTATISGMPTGSVTEDNTVINDALTTSGTLSVSDRDTGDSKFSTTVNPVGSVLGSLSITEAGAWAYNVDNSAVQSLGQNVTKTEKFTVTSIDGTASQEITITINGANDAPTGSPTVTLTSGTEDTAYSINKADLLAGFSDVDGDSLSVSNLTANGVALTADSDGNYVFTPPTNFNGSVTLSYNVVDGKGGSVAATQSFAIAAVNDAPVVATPISTQNGTEDTAILFTIPANTFSDVDDAVLTLSATLGDGSPLPAWLSFDVTTRTFSGTPPQDFDGSLSLKVTATDSGTLNTSSISDLAIAPVNDAPTLNATVTSFSYTDTSNDNSFDAFNGVLTSTDPDAGDPAIYGIVGGGDNNDGTISKVGLYGTLTVDKTTGAYSFTPNDGAIESLKTDAFETFTLIVSDGNGRSDTKDLTINLTGANDTPTLNASLTSTTYTDTANDDTFNVVNGQLSSSDRDANDSADYSISGGTDNGDDTISKVGSYGVLTINKTTGDYTFTPDGKAIEALKADASEVFTLQVTDGSGATASQALAIKIAAVNDTATISGAATGSVTEDSNVGDLLTVSGALSVSDRDTGDAKFSTTVTPLGSVLGNLTITEAGAWAYNVDNSAVQSLGQNVTKLEKFTVTSIDGTATQEITVTITGVNDAAVIGDPTVTGVTEDVDAPTLTATGSISISDADQDQAFFKTAVTKADGTLGDLLLGSDGTYTYSVDNSAVQYLGVGQTKTEDFTIESVDGTTKAVSFTITGVNDAAVIGAPTVAAVTEDLSVNGSGNLTASGVISISDADQDQAAFKTTVAKADGTLGNLVLADDGTYTYSIANSAVQFLGQGITKTETFTVESVDGTTKEVSFIITGVNDAAIIGTPTIATVTEDLNVNGSGNLTASGVISISDADQNQAFFKTTVSKAQGTLGDLLLGFAGTYTYSVANSAVQFLGAEQTKTETFTVESVDGTTKEISFTLTGVNDVAVISGNATASVKEDTNINNGKLTAGNKLTVIDADQGEALFDTGVIFKNNSLNSAALGALSIDANGNFSYSVDNTKAQVQSLGVGQTITETFTVKSKDGTASQDIAIAINGTNDAPIAAAPSRLTQSTQYSDAIQEVVFTATDVDMGDTLVGSIAYSYNGGAFIDGLPDAGSVTGGLSFAFDAASNSWKLSGIADLAPGNYQFRFRATDSQGAFNDNTLTALTVTPENATGITYSGPLFVTTPSKTNLTATIPLQALFEDTADGDRGNITQAKATFFLVNNGTETAINPSPVAVTQTTDLQHGLATYNWTRSLSGNSVSESYTIKVKANNYYAGQSTEYAVVTLASPDGQFMTGGGTLGRKDTLNPGYVGSLGQKADALINFGFNTKYNKTNTNLQGNSNIIIRGQFDNDADVDYYQIKTNATDSLSVFGNSKERATFLSKASLFDLDANVSLQGNLSLRVEVYDAGKTSSTTDVDQFGFTLTNSSGNLLFATSLNNSGLLAMSGGNTAIH